MKVAVDAGEDGVRLSLDDGTLDCSPLTVNNNIGGMQGELQGWRVAKADARQTTRILIIQCQAHNKRRRQNQPEPLRMAQDKHEARTMCHVYSLQVSAETESEE